MIPVLSDFLDLFIGAKFFLEIYINESTESVCHEA